MSGHDVARRVRAELGRSLHLVALTGYGRERDRVEAASSGFDTHMTKPIDIELIERMIEACVTGAATA